MRKESAEMFVEDFVSLFTYHIARISNEPITPMRREPGTSGPTVQIPVNSKPIAEAYYISEMRFKFGKTGSFHAPNARQPNEGYV